MSNYVLYRITLQACQQSNYSMYCNVSRKILENINDWWYFAADCHDIDT